MSAPSSISTSSLIGVSIACTGNVLISLALTVQKLAHRRQNEEVFGSSSSSATSDSPTSPSPRSRRSASSLRRRPRPSNGTGKYDIVPVVLLPSDTSPSQNPSQNPSENPSENPSKNPSENASQLDGEGESEGDGVPFRLDPSSLAGLSDHSRHQKETRSPSPRPIVLPKAYKTDIILRSPSAHSESQGSFFAHHADRDPNQGEQATTPSRGSEESGTEEGEDEEETREVQEGLYLRSKLWWLGMTLIAVGEGGNFLSYGFAPASVVAPLGIVALIANCVFAPLILKERFFKQELVGMGLAIVGAVTVVWAANDSNPRLDPEALVLAIRRPTFIFYVGMTFLAAIPLVLLSRSPRFGPKYIFVDLGVCCIAGGYTVLSTKALSSLVSTIFFDALEYWITWILLAVLISTSVVQIKYLNKALMRFESKLVIPTQFVFFSLSAIIGSAVMFQEFDGVPFTQFINFAFGIATTFLGVYLLTSASEPSSSESVSSEDHPSPALTNASLNLLLPTSARARANTNERTPLLNPIVSPDFPRRPSAAISTAPPSYGVLRLTKRSSTSDFTPSLGLSSQAGFLLMASTPTGSGGMERSVSGSRQGESAAGMDQESARREGRLGMHSRPGSRHWNRHESGSQGKRQDDQGGRRDGDTSV